jgi:hypothetical protein
VKGGRVAFKPPVGLPEAMITEVENTRRLACKEVFEIDVGADDEAVILGG